MANGSDLLLPTSNGTSVVFAMVRRHMASAGSGSCACPNLSGALIANTWQPLDLTGPNIALTLTI